MDIAMKNDKIINICVDIFSAKNAFLKIKRFENEKARLEHQKKIFRVDLQ
jgi:hypothetical protein